MNNEIKRKKITENISKMNFSSIFYIISFMSLAWVTYIGSDIIMSNKTLSLNFFWYKTSHLFGKLIVLSSFLMLISGFYCSVIRYIISCKNSLKVNKSSSFTSYLKLMKKEAMAQKENGLLSFAGCLLIILMFSNPLWIIPSTALSNQNIYVSPLFSVGNMVNLFCDVALFYIATRIISGFLGYFLQKIKRRLTG